MAAVTPCENAPYISIPVSKLFLFCFFNSTGNFFIPAELVISNMERDSNPVKSDRYFLFPFWLWFQDHRVDSAVFSVHQQVWCSSTRIWQSEGWMVCRSFRPVSTIPGKCSLRSFLWKGSFIKRAFFSYDSQFLVIGQKRKCSLRS